MFSYKYAAYFQNTSEGLPRPLKLIINSLRSLSVKYFATRVNFYFANVLLSMYFSYHKNVIFNYNRMNNHTQICFKNKICIKVVSKKRSVKITNSPETTTVLMLNISENRVHRKSRVQT